MKSYCCWNQVPNPGASTDVIESHIFYANYGLCHTGNQNASANPLL